MESLSDNSYAQSPRFLKVRERLLRRFRSERVQSWHALQYWLCEVGVPSDREDPRAVHPAMALRGPALRRATDLPPQPWEPISGVFVSPNVPEAQMPREIADGISKLAQLGILLRDETRAIAECVTAGLSLASKPLEEGRSRPVALCDRVALTSGETIVDLSELAGVPLLASVTNDPEWLYPDDPRLWGHLARCRERRAYAVFIARKISIATFPLLKQMSAIGVQLHQLLVRDSLVDDVTRIAHELTWLSIAGTSKVKSHPGLEIIRQTFAGVTRSFALQLAYDNVALGTSLGLDDTAVASPRALLEWALVSKVPMPDQWFVTIRDWVEWDKRRLLRKPYTGIEWPANV